jgi:hypothetical protein
MGLALLRRDIDEALVGRGVGMGGRRRCVPVWFCESWRHFSGIPALRRPSISRSLASRIRGSLCESVI